MKKCILLAFLLISACANNRFLYTDEKGSPVYQVTCNGAFRTYGDCLEIVGKTCPAGFNILMGQEQQTGSTSQQSATGRYSGNSFGNAAVFGNNNGAMATANSYSSGVLGAQGGNLTMGIFQRYIIYSCK